MINIKLDPSSLLEACKESYNEVKKALTKSVTKLASAAETHLIELTKEELNSHQYKMFVGGDDMKNIELTSPDPNVHILTIKNKAVLIDNGERMDMKTDDWLFSSSKTKTGKKGKYLVIPFQHAEKNSKSESATNRLKIELTNRIKEELDFQNRKRKAKKQRSISVGGIERYQEDSMGHKKGEIIEGKLHEFNIFGSKKKSHWSDMPLTRVGVYQKIKRDDQGNPVTDKNGKVKAIRSWMTFRTASEGSPDKFWYPAPKTKDFLARTGDWVEKEFYENIVPNILKEWKD